MKCPKCGHIMESRREGTIRHPRGYYWKCADYLNCGHVVAWDVKRDGEYNEWA